jgi:hypothetical protein
VTLEALLVPRLFDSIFIRLAVSSTGRCFDLCGEDRLFRVDLTSPTIRQMGSPESGTLVLENAREAQIPSSSTMDAPLSTEPSNYSPRLAVPSRTMSPASQVDMMARNEMRPGLRQVAASGPHADLTDSLVTRVSLFVAAQKEKSEMIHFKQSVEDKIRNETDNIRRSVQEYTDASTKQQNYTQTTMENMSGKFRDHSEAQLKISSTLNTLDGRLMSLEESIASVQREVKTGQDQLQTLTVKLGKLEERVNRQQQQTDDTHDRYNQVDEVIGVIKSDLASMDTNLSQVHSAFGSLSVEELTAICELAPRAEEIQDCLDKQKVYRPLLDRFYAQLDNPMRSSQSHAETHGDAEPLPDEEALRERIGSKRSPSGFHERSSRMHDDSPHGRKFPQILRAERILTE